SDTSDACHPGTQSGGLWIEQHARLDGDELSLSERPVDSNGALDAGAPIVVHLSRTGSAP
ncbi:MAG TPA: hypothetical protein VKT19_07165, partial [Steroidobacteraceae bacterium]|nr:hypothetical protein [Steroidobacteraceae bacterium]